jgi:prevent-host-death family protein
MTTVGTYEAKTHLPRLLKRASRGETILITHHGHPVAKLSPPDSARTMTVKDAVDGILRLAKGRRLAGTTVRGLINEGRRF